MERQKHGIIYETIVCDRLKAVKSKHGSKWDVEDHYGFPISVKTVKEKGAVCLGDFRRVLNYDQDFLMVVGIHSTKPTSFLLGKDIYIKREVVIKMKFDVWKSYFSPNAEKYFEGMSSLLKSISNSREDDHIWATEKSKLKKFYNEHGVQVIRPAPKRDHKTQKPQKRLQAQIPWKSFLKILDDNKLEMDTKYE